MDWVWSYGCPLQSRGPPETDRGHFWMSDALSLQRESSGMMEDKGRQISQAAARSDELADSWSAADQEDWEMT